MLVPDDDDDAAQQLCARLRAARLATPAGDARCRPAAAHVARAWRGDGPACRRKQRRRRGRALGHPDACAPPPPPAGAATAIRAARAGAFAGGRPPARTGAHSHVLALLDLGRRILGDDERAEGPKGPRAR